MTNKTIPAPTATTIVDDNGALLTTSTGRKIRFKELDLEEEMDVTCAIDDERQGKMAYVNIVTITAGIREVDGVPTVLPTNPAMVRAMLRNTGKDCLAAVFDHLKTSNTETDLKNS